MDASEQMINSFSQFSSPTILINLTKILNVLLKLPDQISSSSLLLLRSRHLIRPFISVENQPTPPPYSHLIDLRQYTTKHIHVFKYQLLTFVNNILSADFLIKMVRRIASFLTDRSIDSVLGEEKQRR